MSKPATALETFEAIKTGAITATTVLDETYRRIEQTEPSIQAFISLTKDHAYQTAAKVDAMVKAGEPLPLLAGVPIAIKDNINLIGYPTTCGSKILENYVSPYNATVTEKLLAHLMPIVGKTNQDEFAMGSSTENSAIQLTRNPWDTDRVPGGSSGGSAATVAAGQVAISLGSDTGGSVRQPASLCGLFGIKPTYGRVSRFGLVAYASSLDQISPFARTAADLAALLGIISGHDNHDSTTLTADVPDYLQACTQRLDGLRIGIIDELDGKGMDADVTKAFNATAEQLTQLGATVSHVMIPSIRTAIASYYIIATAEASSNLARFDGVRYGLRKEEGVTDILGMYKKTRSAGFGAEVKRRIMLGTFSLSSGYYDAYYNKAQKARQLLRQEFNAAFRNVDVLICPTSPTTAFKLGEKTADPVSMYLSDIATIPVNLVGIPAMNIPVGFDSQGLPIGVQLMGPHLSEMELFKVALAYENATGITNLVAPAMASVG